MDGFEKLLVGLSGSETDGELIHYACRAAAAGIVGDLHFAHVVSGPISGGAASEVRAALEAQIAAALPGGPPLGRAPLHLADGPRVDRLLRLIADERCDAVLVGHRAGHSGRRSLARRLAMKAPCSVWMVPQNSPPELRRVLAPIDFSEHAADALALATALAARAGLSQCMALYVHCDAALVSFEEYERIARGEEQRTFQQFVAAIDCHGVQVEPRFEEGTRPAETILRVAAQQQADLIVMGIRGRSRSSSVLLGSEAEHTLVSTPVPVLAVKHHGSRLGLLEALLDAQSLKQALRFG